MLNNNMKRPDESIMYLKQLLKHHPDHTKGLLLLGDLNLNHKKDSLAALQNFLSIVDIDPNNIQVISTSCLKLKIDNL